MSFLSRVSYPGDGHTRLFSVPFPYIQASHVKVTSDVGGSPAFQWQSPTQIELTVAPPVGSHLLISRETLREDIVTTFSNGGALDEDALANQAKQLLYICQELSEAPLGIYSGIDGSDMDGGTW